MAGRIWKIARWLVGIGLLIIGAHNVPEPSSSIEQRWGPMIPWPWLEANWIALACFVLAAVLLLYSPLRWWIERQTLKDVRLRIRTNLTPGSFAETDAAQASEYLLHESVWGWRQYARLNFWQVVDGFHLAEFERAALHGDIVTVGRSSREGRTVVVERRLWTHGRIVKSTAAVAGGVTLENRTIGAMGTHSQLAVAAADWLEVWPRASVARRLWSRLWVWSKKQWYGTRLSRWLDKRRHQAKQAREQP